MPSNGSPPGGGPPRGGGRRCGRVSRCGKISALLHQGAMRGRASENASKSGGQRSRAAWPLTAAVKMCALSLLTRPKPGHRRLDLAPLSRLCGVTNCVDEFQNVFANLACCVNRERANRELAAFSVQAALQPIGPSKKKINWNKENKQRYQHQQNYPETCVTRIISANAPSDKK